MHGVMLAARAAVNELGLEHVARALGKSANTLRNELNIKAEGHKLGAEDLLRIDQLHGQGRIATAFAAATGGMYLRLPGGEAANDSDTVRHVTRVVGEFGDVLREVSEVTADGRVSDNELSRVQREALQVMGALQDLLVHLAQVNQAGKPPQLQRVA